jgi:putative transposase
MFGRGRYFSSALDGHYLWNAIRYVERNPARAKVVKRAENYAWSSAAGHCGISSDKVLTDRKYWQNQFESVGDWLAWLAEGDSEAELAIRRRNVEKGLPCGSDRFTRKLEKQAGRTLRYRPMGRPKS